MQNNHKECLETYFKVPAIREDVFIWLNDLESRQRALEDEGEIQVSQSRESINQLILTYIPKLVEMDSSQAIKLVEQWLMLSDSKEKIDHLFIVDEKLKGDSDLIYSYLSTLLTDKEAEIVAEH
jgi:hypothetical protein